jgi:hypothetical protein
LGLLLAALTMIGGLFLAGLSWASRAFSMEPTWQRSAVAPVGAAKLHGLEIPSAARNFYARESGFQDPIDELIFELSPTEVGRFLENNRLERGERGSADAAPVLGLEGPPRATQLEGLRSAENDGGFVPLYRRAQLWEWPGRAFIYCDTWGT